MALIRYDPFRQMDQEREPPGPRGRLLAMDAYRRGDEVFVHLDVPGVARDNIEVTTERDVLFIKVTRRYDEAPEDRLFARERPQGEFERQLHLSDTLAPDRLTASLDAGVLTLRIPVAEAAQPRRVAIQSDQPVGRQAVHAQ